MTAGCSSCPAVAVLLGSGMRPTGREIQRALDPWVSVWITSNRERFRHRLGSFEAGIVALGDGDWVPDQRLPPIVVVANSPPLGELPQGVIATLGVDTVPLALVRNVLRANVVNRLGVHRRAMTDLLSPSGAPKVCEAMALMLGGAPATSVQGAARLVGCSVRRLQKEWSAVGSAQVTLKRCVMAITFLRALSVWLVDPEMSWSTVAGSVGVSQRTLRAYFREWGNCTPGQFKLRQVPSVLVATDAALRLTPSCEHRVVSKPAGQRAG